MSGPIAHTLALYARPDRPRDLPADIAWPLHPGIVWKPFPRTGEPRFHVYIRFKDAKGKSVRRYVDTATSYAQALALQALALGELDRDESPAGKDGRRTFRAACEAYLASIKRRDPSKFNSADAYEKRLTRHAFGEPAFDESAKDPRTIGEMPIAWFTRGRVLEWRDRLERKQAHRSESPLAARTINGVFKTASAAFAFFVDRNWIPTNPLNDWSHLEEPDRPKTIIEERWQMTALLVECDGVRCLDLRDIVTMLLATGCRISEILTLTWDRVHLDNVYSGRALPYCIVIGKGRKLRPVPILDVLLPIMLRRHADRGTSPLVFPGARSIRVGEAEIAAGQRPRNGRAILRKYREAIDAYNAKHPEAPLHENMRLHDTRHTFATHWVEKDGGDLFQLSVLIGHTDVKITQRTYARMSVRGFQDALGRMAFEVPDTKLLPPAAELVAEDEGDEGAS